MSGGTWRGHLDLVQRDQICGWAQDTDHPRQPVRLRILDNGATLGEVLADQYREDLQAAGIGDGRHAFALTVPGGLAPDRRHLIDVRRADDGRALAGTSATARIRDAESPGG